MSKEASFQFKLQPQVKQYFMDCLDAFDAYTKLKAKNASLEEREEPIRVMKSRMNIFSNQLSEPISQLYAKFYVFHITMEDGCHDDKEAYYKKIHDVCGEMIADWRENFIPKHIEEKKDK